MMRCHEWFDAMAWLADADGLAQCGKGVFEVTPFPEIQTAKESQVSLRLC